MRKLFVAVILALFSLQSYAVTCVFAPSSANTVTSTCTLPPMSAGQCIEYHFQWSYREGSTLISESLGASTVISTTIIPAALDTAVHDLKGAVCNITAAQQFPLTGPVFQDVKIVQAPGLGSPTTEDTSEGSSFTFTVSGQRGFGPVSFLGGSVDVR